MIVEIKYNVDEFVFFAEKGEIVSGVAGGQVRERCWTDARGVEYQLVGQGTRVFSESVLSMNYDVAKELSNYNNGEQESRPE